MSDKNDDIEEAKYLEHRKWLIKGEADARTLHDKYIISLAGGAFGLTLVFLSDIAGDQPRGICCLIVGWIALSICILTTLRSFQKSEKAFNREWEDLDKKYDNPEWKPLPNPYIEDVQKFNIVSWWTFCIGLVFVSLFALMNL